MVIVLPEVVKLKPVAAMPDTVTERKVGELIVYSEGNTTVMEEPPVTLHYDEMYLCGIPRGFIIVIVDKPLKCNGVLSYNAHHC